MPLIGLPSLASRNPDTTRISPQTARKAQTRKPIPTIMVTIPITAHQRPGAGLALYRLADSEVSGAIIVENNDFIGAGDGNRQVEVTVPIPVAAGKGKGAGQAR